MSNKDKERIAIGLMISVCILVITATVLDLTGTEIPEFFRLGVVFYTILTGWYTTFVYGRYR